MTQATTPLCCASTHSAKRQMRRRSRLLSLPLMWMLASTVFTMLLPNDGYAGTTGPGKLISTMTAGRNFLGSSEKLIILNTSFTARYCGADRTVSVVVIPASMPAETLRGIEALAFIALSTRTPITFELANTCSSMFGTSYPHVAGASLAVL